MANNLFRLLEIIFIYSIWYILLIASMIALSIITVAWAAKEKITEWRTQSMSETNTIK